MPVKNIPIRLIDTDIANHRRKVDKAALGELVASIKAQGLLQPVEIWKKPKGARYTLAFGFRRLAAFKQLGEKSIPAQVIPASKYDEGAIRLSQAAENIMRAALDPVEEALACAALVDDALAVENVSDETIKQTVDRIAGRLARPRRWIEDRVRLARLCADVRDDISAGRLPLGHALVIARLGDPAQQREFARWARIGDDECPGIGVDRLRRYVEHKLTSLRGVPWELGVAFAGKPACSDCPHNTENQHGLFKGVGKDDETPELRCLKRGCWDSKNATALEAQNKVVKKLVALKTAAATKARELAPEYLKISAVTRKAKARLENKSTGEKGRGEERAARKTNSPAAREEDPQHRYNRAHWDWRQKLCDSIEKGCTSPERFTLLHLIDMHDAMSPFAGKEDKAVRILTPLAQLLRDPKPADIVKMAKAVLSGRHRYIASPLEEAPDAILPVLATALGVEVPTEPRIEDFVKPEKPAPVEGEKPTRKKPVRKKRKTTTRKTTKKTKTTGRKGRAR